MIEYCNLNVSVTKYFRAREYGITLRKAPANRIDGFSGYLSEVFAIGVEDDFIKCVPSS